MKHMSSAGFRLRKHFRYILAEIGIAHLRRLKKRCIDKQKNNVAVLVSVAHE